MLLSKRAKQYLAIALSDQTIANELIKAIETGGSGGGLNEAQVQAFIDIAIAGLVNGAPETLNTLRELAAALDDDESFATTVINALALKANATDVYTQTQIDTLLSDKADISSLATVATSGAYNDLSGKPTIPAAQVNSDWTANTGVAQILNKPTLATVATSGSYNDLSNKPTSFTPARVYTAGVDAATLQGTIDLASAQSPTLSSAVLVLVPPKTGGWSEDITLKDSVYVKAMGNLNDTSCVIINGSVTFTPTAANSVTARSSIEGFQITKNVAGPVIQVTGNKDGQLNVVGCYIQNTNTSTSAVCIQNNSTGGAPIYSYANLTRMSGTAGQGGCHYDAASSTVYVMNGCDMSGGTKLFNVAAGKYLQCIYSFGQCNGPDAVTVAASGLTAIGFSTLANMSTNGNVINLTASGAVTGVTSSYMEAQNGTGYVVTGVSGSIFTFANIITGNVAGVQTRNVKIKNTVTAIAYTTTLTSSP